MRADAINIEDGRLEGLDLNNYPWFHERHRLFPEIFEKGKYKKILDIAAGVGVVGKRIHEKYPCYMLCNDISTESIKSLKSSKLNTISFDLDDSKVSFPFADDSFDSVISLATIEHIINLDHHMNEIKRILSKNGHLYLSAPNYNGIHFVLPFLFKGKAFHNPMNEGIDKYEFYAHVRYFTHNTLVEFIESFGFQAEKVYLPLPKNSSKFNALKNKSSLLAFTIKASIYLLYKLLPPRWAFHPVICFSKKSDTSSNKYKKPEIVIV